MKRAQNGEYFQSDVFKMCELDWEIAIYPNGRIEEREGSFDVYLRLLSLPKEWECITTCKTVKCPQTKASFTSCSEYTKDESDGWGLNIMTSEDIRNLRKLDIEINIKILNIILRDSTSFYETNITQSPATNRTNTFEWQINRELFRTMQKCHNGMAFESPIFDNMWCIRVWPNGGSPDDEAWCNELILCGLPPNKHHITAEWTVKTVLENAQRQVMEKKLSLTDDFDYEQSCRSWTDPEEWNDDDLSFDDIQRSTKMTISVDIKILDDANNESEQAALLKWREYVKEDEEKKQEISDDAPVVAGNNKDEDRLNIIQSKLESISLQLKQLAINTENINKNKQLIDTAMSDIATLKVDMDKLKNVIVPLQHNDVEKKEVESAKLPPAQQASTKDLWHCAVCDTPNSYSSDKCRLCNKERIIETDTK